MGLQDIPAVRFTACAIVNCALLILTSKRPVAGVSVARDGYRENIVSPRKSKEHLRVIPGV
jgi:hypothetical protein